MLFLNFVKKHKNYLILLLGNYIVALLAGAPWEDLDGKYYWLIAQNFFSRFLFQSSWQPLGYAFFLMPFSILKISIVWPVVLLTTFNQVLVWKFLEKTSAFFKSAFIFFFFCPIWFFLGLTTLTENLFLSLILLTALLLKNGINNKKRFLYLAILFGFCVWTRHAGLFLLPAFVAVGFLESFKGSLTFLAKIKRLSVFCASLIFAFALSNLLNTASPLKPSRGKHACVQMMGPLSYFPYCKDGLARDLCAYDKDGTLNKADFTIKPLYHIQFDEDSPVVRYVADKGQEAICQDLKEISFYYLIKKPQQVASYLLARLWQHMGPWEGADVLYHEVRHKNSISLKFHDLLKEGVEGAKFLLKYSNVYWLALSLLFLFLKLYKEPLALFLFLGAWGHALGLSLNNPLPLLRYQVMSQSFLFLLQVPIYFKIREKIKIKSLS